MNREDILHMAKESGMYRILDEHANEFGAGMFEDMLYAHFPELEQFATLVVANIDPKSSMAWQEGYEAGVVAEREACAKLCEKTDYFYGAMFAKPIRARGKE